MEQQREPLTVDVRGYFWWAETPVPNGVFAPESAIAGSLKIDAEGKIELTLDGILSRPQGRLSAPFHNDHASRAIGGILGDGRHVRLDHLSQDGMSASTNAPSQENFQAQRAVLARRAFSQLRPIRLKEVRLDLGEAAYWFGRPGIDYEETGGRVAVRYKPPRPRRWVSGGATLYLERGVTRPAASGHRSALTLQEFALLRYRPQRSIDLDQAIEIAMRLEDLMVLLTDAERSLTFPQARATTAGRVEIYFGRARRKATAVHWADIWISYPQVEESLGQLVQSWLSEHERLGPGFHLYLGNRRGVPLYPEHRFASLVWGLESLHRSLTPPADDANLRAKVERIVAQIAKRSDKKWAERRLFGSAEPALAERLHELFLPLPIPFAEGKLMAFCMRCAGRRNDVSHWGGGRPGQSYEDFLAEIQKLSQALDLLYHARILQTVGVSDALIARVFSEAGRAPVRRRILKAAGLGFPDPAGASGDGSVSTNEG